MIDKCLQPLIDINQRNTYAPGKGGSADMSPGSCSPRASAKPTQIPPPDQCPES